MSVIGSSILAGASGSAGGDKVYVDDVFSTFLYEGNNVTGRNIVNGIDLAGEGGLAWVKKRSATEDHVLLDTERGENNFLISNSSAAANTSGGPITAFRSDGFTVDNNVYVNANSTDYVSWTFRKAPGFFDVVTYTGTGSARTVAHNLGSVPGMILIKCTSHTSDWSVYHRSMGATKNMHLNTSAAADTQTGVFNDTEPTATNFTVNYDGDVNGSGKAYVAYIFAHDDAKFGTDEDESIIKCGTYTGNGGSSNTIDVGFEPGFLLIKASSYAEEWVIFDEMRGTTQRLRANSSGSENDPSGLLGNFTSTGFFLNGSSNQTNRSGTTYIYMAIRRPNKPPEAGTEVFAIDTKAASFPNYTSGFPVDFVITRDGINSGNDNQVISRIASTKFLKANATAAESNGFVAAALDYQNGFAANTGSANSSNYAWMFKRAPGFMDVVAYSGTGSPHTINHNLTVPPELMFVKSRSYADAWHVYSSALGNTKYISLNTSTQASTLAVWNNTTPTSSVFSVGSRGETNTNNETYIAYLFATLPGISKVGSYSGTGSALNIDCGFTAGARFVLIKRTDGTGNWYLFDTTRGIVSGNDFALALNLSSAQISGDYIDPLAAGFTINGSYAQWNESGGTYMFLAIA